MTHTLILRIPLTCSPWVNAQWYLKRMIFTYKPAVGTKYTNADQTDTQPTTATASNQSFLSIFCLHRKSPVQQSINSANFINQSESANSTDDYRKHSMQFNGSLCWSDSGCSCKNAIKQSAIESVVTTPSPIISKTAL